MSCFVVMKAQEQKHSYARSVSGLGHYWLGQHPYPSLSIKAHTVSGCVLLRSISNHIIGYDRMVLSCALNALRQACGLCHMVFNRFISSDGSQDIRIEADVSAWGNVDSTLYKREPLKNSVIIHLRCCGKGTDSRSPTFNVSLRS